LPAEIIINANSFEVAFAHNLFSPGNVMYSIKASNLLT
jgi:hypothetical protein